MTSSSAAPVCSRRVWSSGKCWQATRLLLQLCEGGIFVEHALWFGLLDHRGRLVRMPVSVCREYDCLVCYVQCCYKWHKTDTSVATLQGAWRYRDSAGTGWFGVSIVWVGKTARLICNFYLSVAARTTVWAGPSLRYTSMLLGRQATNKQQPQQSLAKTSPPAVYETHVRDRVQWYHRMCAVASHNVCCGVTECVQWCHIMYAVVNVCCGVTECVLWCHRMCAVVSQNVCW